MKVFITGGTGLLGNALLQSKPGKVSLFASYHKNRLIPDTGNCGFFPLDIRNKKQVQKIIRHVKPAVIVHAAAKSSPDFCESFKKIAWETNVIGTRNILAAGEEIGARVIFTSSNQVFSGKNPPYTETANTDPVNYYGKTKVQSENDVLLRKDSRFTVLRLMTMYGWGNPEGQRNTAMWVIDSLSQGKPIKVVDDVYNNFLWVGQAAEAMWRIIFSKKKISLIQIAGAEVASRYGFAKKVASAFRLNSKLITPVKKSYFTDEAPRPLNTIYDTAFSEQLLSIKPLSLQAGLGKMSSQKRSTKWKYISVSE